jgi:hypothetical protein
VERRKKKGTSQFGIYYIYTWKCHNETPCIATLNVFFSKKDRKVKQVLSGSCFQWEGEGYKGEGG